MENLSVFVMVEGKSEKPLNVSSSRGKSENLLICHVGIKTMKTLCGEDMRLLLLHYEENA